VKDEDFRFAFKTFKNTSIGLKKESAAAAAGAGQGA
jgi:hypothetical protein